MTKLQVGPSNVTDLIEGGNEVVYRAANASKTWTKIHLKLCKDRALKTVLKFILNPVKTGGLRQFGHSLLALYSWIKIRGGGTCTHITKRRRTIVNLADLAKQLWTKCWTGGCNSTTMMYSPFYRCRGSLEANIFPPCFVLSPSVPSPQY